MRLSSSLQTILAGVGGVFAPRKEMHAQARIDPESPATSLEGAGIAEPPLVIGVRLVNPRSEVVARKEAVHE